MRLHRHGLAGLALFCAALPMTASADTQPLQAFQMVRSLQVVQDRLALGDHAAMPMQRKLLEMIDKRLRETGSEGYEDPRNIQSLMVYAMSGGNPATVAAVLSRITINGGEQGLADGILAYLNGDVLTARARLAEVDALVLPHEMGAFLALVKGSVNAAEQPAQALKLLDQARLLGPGTLVEEAALRRSVDLAGTTGDADRFMLASTQYVARYLRSPYASQFADSFISGIVALHEAIELDRIDDITTMMDPDQQQSIYLRIARRAAIEGYSELSAFAAGKVQHVSDRKDDPRALLYASLSSVATGTAEQIRTSLARIDRNLLSQDDRELFDAVSSVAGKLTAARPATLQPAPTPAPAPEAAPVAEAPADALVAETRRKLDEIDKLLEGEIR